MAWFLKYDIVVGSYALIQSEMMTQVGVNDKLPLWASLFSGGMAGISYW
jgi:hypothetical protein